MREIDKVRSLSAEELVKYFGVDCSRCGKCNSDDDADKKTYDDCVKGNIEFFNEPHSLEDLGYHRLDIGNLNVWQGKNNQCEIRIDFEHKYCEKCLQISNLSMPFTITELKIILKMLEN